MAHLCSHTSQECQMTKFKKEKPIEPFWHSQHIQTHGISLSQPFWAILATPWYISYNIRYVTCGMTNSTFFISEGFMFRREVPSFSFFKSWARFIHSRDCHWSIRHFYSCIFLKWFTVCFQNFFTFVWKTNIIYEV